MIARKQSTTTYPVQFLMVDSTDHVTAETGLSPTVTISKNGGAYGAASGAVTEVGNGVYAFAGNASDRDTLGELMIHAEATGADKVDMKVLITSYDPFVDIASILADTGTDGVVLKAAGLAGDAIAEIADGVWIHDIGSYGAGEAGGDLLGWLTIIAGYLNEAGRIDLLIDSIITHLTDIKGAGWTNETLVKIVSDIAAISAGSGATAQEVWEYATRVLTAGTNIDLSALATATDLATVDTVVDAIKAKTDNLPADPAAVGSAMTLTAAYDKAKDDVLTPLAVVDLIVNGLKTTLDNIHDTDLPAVKTETAAIKAKTDNLPATPAQAGEYTAAIAAIPTTPLLAANYTAPDNAGIAAIKAKTDQLIFTTPNKVDASATIDPTGLATSAALAVVDANVDAIKAKTDALDVSSVTVVAAVNGTTITILRGDTFSGVFTNIGALTDYVSIDFTVKEAYSKTDNEATIRIRKNASGVSDGLMRLNGAAASSSALGSIAIDDLASGDITITLDETATDDLSTGTYVYDIQMISAAGVKTLTYGKLIVSADVTRLVA